MAHEDIISILTKLIDSDNLPHLLLYGPPGTGKVRTDFYSLFELLLIVELNIILFFCLKTSTIVAAAKRMYGGDAAYNSMTLELNASDSRGIDVRIDPCFDGLISVGAIRISHFFLLGCSQ